MDHRTPRHRRKTAPEVPTAKMGCWAVDVAEAIDGAVARTMIAAPSARIAHESVPGPRVSIPRPLLERALDRLLSQILAIRNEGVRIRTRCTGDEVQVCLTPAPSEELDATFTAALHDHGGRVERSQDGALCLVLPRAVEAP
jgi:hypothetical protein